MIGIIRRCFSNIYQQYENNIEVYKIINLEYDARTTVALDFSKDSKTRGYKYKLNQNHCKYDLRKHFCTNKIVGNLE